MWIYKHEMKQCAYELRLPEWGRCNWAREEQRQTSTKQQHCFPSPIERLMIKSENAKWTLSSKSIASSSASCPSAWSWNKFSASNRKLNRDNRSNAIGGNSTRGCFQPAVQTLQAHFELNNERTWFRFDLSTGKYGIRLQNRCKRLSTFSRS